MTETRSSMVAPSPAGTVEPGADVDEDGSPDEWARPSGYDRNPGRADRESEEAADGQTGLTIRIPNIPVRRVVGVGLTGVGVLLVLFVFYLFAFTPLTASRNQQRLVGSLVGQPLSVYSLVSGHVPPEGSAAAVLEIPALGLHQVVVEGTSASDLMDGPGLMPGSALPGSPGNSVIAGRRVTFGAPFASLGDLRRGDRIRTVDGAGTFTYRVVRTEVVGAGQRDVITPTTDSRLTLITSNSSAVPSGRLAVVARLVGRPVAVPANVVAVPTYELGLAGDPVAGGLLVMWSLITIVVLVGAALVAWRSRRPWLVYLFAVPVLVACGLFACESLARALPATF
ncbi:MAG: sortase [Acidimicrobiales bacterium]